MVADSHKHTSCEYIVVALLVYYTAQGAIWVCLLADGNHLDWIRNSRPITTAQICCLTDVVKLVPVELIRVLLLVPINHSFVQRYLNAVVETVMHRIPKVPLIDVFDAVRFKHVHKTIQNPFVLVIALSLKSNFNRLKWKIQQ